MSTPSGIALPPTGPPARQKAETAAGGIQAFRHAHRWLVIALVLTVLGFTPPYFLKLAEANWQQHLHGLSAMLWMLLVVVQPYLATHGRLAIHRQIGRIALILAGVVVASALSILPANIENAVSGETSVFVPPTFFYGITFLDLVVITGFAVSVAMAAHKVRQPAEHAWWMIASAFWVLTPGLARFFAFSMLFTVGVEGWTLTDIVVLTAFPVLAVLAWLMMRLRRAHPALLLAFFGNCSAFVVAALGDNTSWRNLTEMIFLSP